MGRWLGIFGVVVTACYVTIWGFNVRGEWEAFKALELNELGDFLGGTFGPLAFFWLVLGFFQQGIELRQNSQALKLQANELAESARQQRELVAATREQIALEREALADQRERLHRAAQPHFVVKTETTPRADGMEFVHIITNVGAECMRPTISMVPPNPAISSGKPNDLSWPRTQPGHIRYMQHACDQFPKAIVRIDFIDADGHLGAAEFVLEDGVLRAVDPPVPRHV
jgi:hypothetical protein